MLLMKRLSVAMQRGNAACILFYALFISVVDKIDLLFHGNEQLGARQDHKNISGIDQVFTSLCKCLSDALQTMTFQLNFCIIRRL